jgi:hypothetical protein
MKRRETKRGHQGTKKIQNGEKREEEKETSIMTSKMEPPMPQVLVS